MTGSMYLRNDHRLHVSHNVFSFRCPKCDDTWWNYLKEQLPPITKEA